MIRSPKKKQRKKLSYRLIERESVAGQKWYPVVELLIAQHHEDLREARIALAWNLSWKPDVDGRVVLGKCKLASELDRELSAFDFVIILRQEFFENPRVTDQQRRALLDHELCHAAVKHDATGEPVIDERGRIVYRTRKHDLEEFSEIVDRHGCWKKDLEFFAAALARARGKTSQWVGYRGVRERLIAAGADVPLETIIGWTEDERREADLWAVVRAELKRRGLEEMDAKVPEHVQAAIAVPSLPIEAVEGEAVQQ